MSPPLILWINSVMDTVAASILASEVPASKEVNNEIFSKEDYESILDHTSPFNA